MESVTIHLTHEQIVRLDDLAGRELRTREAQATWLVSSRLEPVIAGDSIARGKGGRPRSPVARCLAAEAGCGTPAASRGVCRRHRNMQHYYVKSGHLTEAWLVRNGKLLPDPTGVPASAEPPVLPPGALLGNEKLWLFGLLHVTAPSGGAP